MALPPRADLEAEPQPAQPERVTLPPLEERRNSSDPPSESELAMELAPGFTFDTTSSHDPSQTSTILWRSASSPAAHRPIPGGSADFGPYTLLEEIGRGGMGVVYKAQQKGLDRIVAVKMILASHLASPEQVDRFYAEARAAARLQDPRVVSIHDVGQIHGQHYFAMEYVAGPSLAELLLQGPLQPDAAARLVLTVARTVARLHHQGVVHRDLKPSNILLDNQGQPCVTDFGLAKMLSSDAPNTHTGAIVGTPSYMAPEQAAGRGSAVGPLSDVYSLGAILFELLTGRPPFDQESPLDTLVQVLEGEPPPPTSIRVEIPKSLEQICMRCLEKDPAARYARADDLADDLERFVRGEPVEARRLSLWNRLNRWTRREPALVSRLVTFLLGGLFLQLDQLLLSQFDRVLNRRILIVLALGTAASLIFQTLLKRDRWSTLARYSWSTADMILFSSLVLFSDALVTPLVGGYLLLISASGLWFRERLVWYTAGLAALSYTALALFALWIGQESPLLFVAALVLLGIALAGFVTAYQVKRVRALSSFYENRPLP